MNTYCLSCKKDTKNIDLKVIKTKNNRKMILSRCSICNNKKSTFISQGSGIFDSLIYNTRYIYRNELNKACFQHDSDYADHKDLINRTKSDKVLRDKAYNIASNPKYGGYQRGLASMVYNFFDKKSTAQPSSLERMRSGLKKLKNSSSILADELHKAVIKKFEKRKVYSRFSRHAIIK